MCLPGVSAQGVISQGEGGVSARGCLPGGMSGSGCLPGRVSPRGVCVCKGVCLLERVYLQGGVSTS